ncbi:MAG: DUF2267 domain-containing protein [Halobacteriales archaeon]|nr:DUF2267 domain-containing protein [Halobacteriales archaeon]
MEAERFYQALCDRLGVEVEPATRIAEATLMALHLRMPEAEAQQFSDALPSDLRRLFAHGGEDLKAQRGSFSKFTRQQFLQYVADRLGVRDTSRAQAYVQATFAVLRQQLPEADVLVQRALPADLRDLWLGTAPRQR